MNQKEIHSLGARELTLHLEVELLIVESLLLITSDLDLAAAADWSLTALKVLNESLISGSDDLMECKLQLTDLVVTGIVVKIVKVIDIVHDDLILFTLLKVILHVEGLDPFRVEVIHDDLGLSDLVPEVA